MINTTIQVLREHGYQAIADLDKARLPTTFRGRPLLRSYGLHRAKFAETTLLCPTAALTQESLDMGRCIFCGECAARHPENITFANDYMTATSVREELVIRWDTQPHKMTIERHPLFRNSLKLRQVSAGGDSSQEMDLNATGNVNFDMARHGIEFTASPRHADGIVITGPITRNMARENQAVLDAIPEPRLIILVGSDAISGGLFDGSPALDRRFIERHHINLYVPGNPAHPLAFIHGIRSLMGSYLVDAEKTSSVD